MEVVVSLDSTCNIIHLLTSSTTTTSRKFLRVKAHYLPASCYVATTASLDELHRGISAYRQRSLIKHKQIVTRERLRRHSSLSLSGLLWCCDESTQESAVLFIPKPMSHISHHHPHSAFYRVRLYRSRDDAITSAFCAPIHIANSRTSRTTPNRSGACCDRV